MTVYTVISLQKNRTYTIPNHISFWPILQTLLFNPSHVCAGRRAMALAYIIRFIIRAPRLASHLHRACSDLISCTSLDASLHQVSMVSEFLERQSIAPAYWVPVYWVLLSPIDSYCVPAYWALLSPCLLSPQTLNSPWLCIFETLSSAWGQMLDQTKY